MKKKIAEYEVGEQVDIFLLIKTATKGIASNGKPFLTVILQDPSGDIEAKLWDVSPEVEKQYRGGNNRESSWRYFKLQRPYSITCETNSCCE